MASVSSGICWRFMPCASRAPTATRSSCGPLFATRRDRSNFAETASLSTPANGMIDTDKPAGGWPAAEVARVSPAASSSTTTMLKANRSVRLMRQESRRRGGESRLAAFVSAVALLTLAWYGQDIISQLGRVTALPVEEIDGILYFIICFNVVSLVVPRSRYDL